MSRSRRISADGANATGEETGVEHALNLMREALSLLDTSHGPHDVRAHLDLAINRLQASFDTGDDSAA